MLLLFRTRICRTMKHRTTMYPLYRMSIGIATLIRGGFFGTRRSLGGGVRYFPWRSGLSIDGFPKGIGSSTTTIISSSIVVVERYSNLSRKEGTNTLITTGGIDTNTPRRTHMTPWIILFQDAFIDIQYGEGDFEALCYGGFLFSTIISTNIMMIIISQPRNTTLHHPFPHPPMNLRPTPLHINPHHVGHVGVDFGVDEREDGRDVGGGGGLMVCEGGEAFAV